MPVDANMKFIRKLPVPKEIKAQFPLTPEGAAIKEKRMLKSLGWL